MRSFQFLDSRLQRDDGLLIPLNLIDFSSGWYMATKFCLDAVHFLLERCDLSAQVVQHFLCCLAFLFFA